mmetsp:Transcript_7984/g.25384  ORF Transcript_7984/g.25384 Transcript_7984/m.25384 type:complete len:346 (-) Transcript_7984:180-1217(-)
MDAADTHGPGVRPPAAQFPRPHGHHREAPGGRHPGLLRRQEDHLGGVPVAELAPHRRLRRLLCPVHPADPLLQRTPEDGGAHGHGQARAGRHRPLPRALRNPLRHARVHGALDAGAAPQDVWVHGRHLRDSGAHHLRRVHRGGRRGQARRSTSGHVLALCPDILRARHLDPLELLPGDHRRRLRRGEGGQREERRRSGHHHRPRRRLLDEGRGNEAGLAKQLRPPPLLHAAGRRARRPPDEQPQAEGVFGGLGGRQAPQEGGGGHAREGGSKGRAALPAEGYPGGLPPAEREPSGGALPPPLLPQVQRHPERQAQGPAQQGGRPGHTGPRAAGYLPARRGQRRVQ